MPRRRDDACQEITLANQATLSDALEIDLIVTSALASAAVAALMSISPISKTEIYAALRSQIKKLAMESDDKAATACTLLRQFMPVSMVD